MIPTEATALRRLIVKYGAESSLHKNAPLDGVTPFELAGKEVNLMIDALTDDEMPRPEKVLRRLLAFRFGGALLYADDGELQDNAARPCIDFKRDSVDQIEEKMGERCRLALTPDQIVRIETNDAYSLAISFSTAEAAQAFYRKHVPTAQR